MSLSGTPHAPGHGRPVARRRAVATIVGALALAAGSAAVGSPGTAATPHATSWGKVTTVAEQKFQDLTSVTTNNGMVVAAWNDTGSRHAYVATRSAGRWSTPTSITSDAAVLAITKAGDGAWLAWQGSKRVSAVYIASDGDVGTPEVVGKSSDPFVVDLHVAAGGTGAVAVSWQTKTGQQSMLAYRSGGYWQPAEEMASPGSVEGLVTDSAGAVQVVLSTGQLNHETLTYQRRASDGTWGDPFVVSSNAARPSVTGNAEGDVVVGWQTRGSKAVTLVARYKAAKDQDFGDSHQLSQSVPSSSVVAFGMAADGSLAAAYQIASSGSQQIQMTPADSTGLWLDPQDLTLETQAWYAVAMNDDGSYVVVNKPATKGTQFVRCDSANVCGDTETNAATGDHAVSASLDPKDVINLVWGRGCKGEGCYPTSVVAQRGR